MSVTWFLLYVLVPAGFMVFFGWVTRREYRRLDEKREELRRRDRYIREKRSD